MNKIDALVLLPRIRVMNANMISGPLSWGFPSITAFLGVAHRLFREGDVPVRLSGAGVVCHHFEPRTSRAPGRRTLSLCLSRHPVDKDGVSAPLVEEGRASLDVSLVLGVSGYLPPDEGREVAEHLFSRVLEGRVAGGSVLPPTVGSPAPMWLEMPDALETADKAFRSVRHRLLPGFALTERSALLKAHVEEMRRHNPRATSFDALFDLCRINVEPERLADHPEQAAWAIRKKPGWLVPIPIGYKAISPLYAPGEVRNARDAGTPFRFVESVYTLGEWKSPHRLSSPLELLWEYRADPQGGLYLCRQACTVAQ